MSTIKLILNVGGQKSNTIINNCCATNLKSHGNAGNKNRGISINMLKDEVQDYAKTISIGQGKLNVA